MNQSPCVLSINGSDSSGFAGIQADIKTISAMGGHALTAITSVAVQDRTGIQNILDLPSEVIIGQVKSIVSNLHPKAIKVGLVRSADTMHRLKSIIGGTSRILLTAGIMTSNGERLMTDNAIDALKHYLLPEAALLMIRCNEAELLLRQSISTDDDMLKTAHRLMEMGAGAVLLRGGHQVKDRLTALLCTPDDSRFFTSGNTEGWQKHGVGGALSAAIATRMAMGDDITAAISNAHDYIHSQVVYAVTARQHSRRAADIYNKFMTLIAEHYRQAHDVASYADRLAITMRYLSQVTDNVVGKSPKQVIADYLMKEAKALLANSRLSISEISFKLGFSSPAMFSKFFSNCEGCPPAEYRNRMSRL
jgi:hydroxymethylpyrimidine/phosphomethylpyrimidine kinase